MRGKLLLIAVGALLSAPFVHAQAATACPSAKTLDDLVKALDDAVSGPTDKDRTCMRQLLIPEARLIPVEQGKRRLNSAAYSESR